MTSITTSEGNRGCKICGKPVIDTGSGGVVHENGGTVEQLCQNCGWRGGQVGRFSNCPRCGDGTSLKDEHFAS